jgi:hypothetical protein
MIRLWKSFCMVFLFVVAMTLPAISEELKTVTSEGVAAIQGNARDIARNAAIEDAQRRAVEQAIGSLIDSRTQVENYQLISDKILSQTKGYIKQYTVAGETTDSGLLRVSINAEVALGRLTDDLSGIGIRISRGQKLRSVNITITGLNKTQFAKFKDVLLKQLRGIKDLQERSFSGITAKISVYSKNSTQTLSDEIRLRDFGAFSVEVMSSTANSLELKVTPKQ